ncbi:hypothetical protein [Parashewanella spongiae]|uniref:hypothetical protein n=1 Tax=Parashewanella spongiae TaxID=342950 RepID=UPI001476AA2B|nr:hypothetical protein [Parashewanella spongiae]
MIIKSSYCSNSYSYTQRSTDVFRFKENDLKPWQKKMWCVGNMNANYIAQMEHVLDVYARPKNSAEPGRSDEAIGFRCCPSIPSKIRAISQNRL